MASYNSLEMLERTLRAHEQVSEQLTKMTEILEKNQSFSNSQVIERLQLHELQLARREEAMVEAMKSIAETTRATLKHIRYIEQFTEVSSSKLGCMEMRQTELAGEGTDMSRMFDAYSRGSSAVCSQGVVKSSVRSLIELGGPRGLQYSGIFSSKDVVRTEALTCHFWRTFVEANWSSWSNPGYEELGALVHHQPSCRAKIIREFLFSRELGLYREIDPSAFEKDMLGGKLPECLQRLHFLALPTGTRLQILEDTEDFRLLRAAAHKTSVERPAEDHKWTLLEESPDEAYARLDEKVYRFFETFPACCSRDVRVRVTQGLVAWALLSDDVVEKKRKVETAKYKADEAAEWPQACEDWGKQWALCAEWAEKNITEVAKIELDYKKLKEAEEAEAQEAQVCELVEGHWKKAKSSSNLEEDSARVLESTDEPMQQQP